MSVKTFCLNCGGFIEGDEIVMGTRGFVCKACELREIERHLCVCGKTTVLEDHHPQCPARRSDDK